MDDGRSGGGEGGVRARASVRLPACVSWTVRPRERGLTAEIYDARQPASRARGH